MNKSKALSALLTFYIVLMGSVTLFLALTSKDLSKERELLSQYRNSPLFLDLRKCQESTFEESFSILRSESKEILESKLNILGEKLAHNLKVCSYMAETLASDTRLFDLVGEGQAKAYAQKIINRIQLTLELIESRDNDVAVLAKITEMRKQERLSRLMVPESDRISAQSFFFASLFILLIFSALLRGKEKLDASVGLMGGLKMMVKAPLSSKKKERKD